MLKKIFYYTKKIITLGPKRSSTVALNRIKNKLVSSYWRRRALQGVAQYSWKYISLLCDSNKFETFFEWQRFRSLLVVSGLYEEKIDKNQIIQEANFFVKNGIKVFGDLHCFTKISWHTDINLHAKNIKADCDFDPHIFYKDIKINSGRGNTLQKDIKVPWELSRFYYLFVLGKAYELTGDKKYSSTFVQHITDWLDNNPYLLGINWVCPMEVALRAINWVVAFSFFKNADIDQEFWERFTCSLYDHFIYLENNWEIYDSRTSNHYLSDLVGYLYLCWFFKYLNGVKQKLDWVHQEIIKEMTIQIFNEGTDYEGSTYYHQLVTELFYHAYVMFQECNLQIPQHFVQKLPYMFEFIEWCTPYRGQLISIGDNDSGRVLYYGLPEYVDLEVQKQYGTKHFSQFGISIIKNKKWHATLRHHAYQAQQPSGHFHNDNNSITLAIDGIPVFIDPGSYVYTPSVYWRNTFRSVQVHNTFFVNGIEPVPLNDQLFFLDISNVYKKYNIIPKRELAFDEQNNELIVIDQWQGKNKLYLQSTWNFTLGPNIKPKKENNIWLLQHNKKTLITLCSNDLDFELHNAWVSLEYGKKIKSVCLRAKQDLQPNQQIYIYLSLPK